VLMSRPAVTKSAKTFKEVRSFSGPLRARAKILMRHISTSCAHAAGQVYHRIAERERVG
jgi:hypothetical protein